MSTPTSGPAPATEAGAPPPLQRPHPLTPLIRGWVVLAAFVFGFGRDYITNSGEQHSAPLAVVLGGLAVLCVVAAISGFLTWRFTAFVIGGGELRIDSGVLRKRSTRIAYGRIQSVDLLQPLAARLFGLCELRIDVGSSGNRHRLRYLTRKDGARFRDYLLARAHGLHDAELTESAADLIADRAPTDRVVATAGPDLLIFGFLLSHDVLILVGILIGVVVVAAWNGALAASLSVIIPLGAGLYSMVTRRLLSQFNFSLSDTGHGLRISRGLTSLTSQSIPRDRIQGLRVRQSLLWRPFGWYRVDVDVLGHKAGREDNQSGSSSILLPVARRHDVRAVLDAVLPGLDLDPVMHRVPRRAALLRWFDFWTLRYGWTEDVVASEHGWLQWSRSLVPHAKTQSARIDQGPVQRLLRLAQVHIDTTPGPVDLTVQHAPPEVAQELCLGQLDRARRARERDRFPVQMPVQIPAPAPAAPMSAAPQDQ